MGRAAAGSRLSGGHACGRPLAGNWTLLACYNAKHNSPFRTVVPGTPYRPMESASDSAILSAGVRFATGEERFQSTYVEEQKKAAGLA